MQLSLNSYIIKGMVVNIHSTDHLDQSIEYSVFRQLVNLRSADNDFTKEMCVCMVEYIVFWPLPEFGGGWVVSVPIFVLILLQYVILYYRIL